MATYILLQFVLSLVAAFLSLFIEIENPGYLLTRVGYYVRPVPLGIEYVPYVLRPRAEELYGLIDPTADWTCPRTDLPTCPYTKDTQPPEDLGNGYDLIVLNVDTCPRKVHLLPLVVCCLPILTLIMICLAVSQYYNMKQTDVYTMTPVITTQYESVIRLKGTAKDASRRCDIAGQLTSLLQEIVDQCENNFWDFSISFHKLSKEVDFMLYNGKLKNSSDEAQGVVVELQRFCYGGAFLDIDRCTAELKTKLFGVMKDRDAIDFEIVDMQDWLDIMSLPPPPPKHFHDGPVYALSEEHATPDYGLPPRPTHHGGFLHGILPDHQIAELTMQDMQDWEDIMALPPPPDHWHDGPVYVGNPHQTPAPTGNAPTRPTLSDSIQTPAPTGNAPTTPTAPTGNAPAAPTAPTGNAPTAPTAPTGNAPTAPTGNAPTAPTAPTGNAPTTPTGNAPTAPTAPTGNAPTTPTAPTGNAPTRPARAHSMRPYMPTIDE